MTKTAGDLTNFERLYRHNLFLGVGHLGPSDVYSLADGEIEFNAAEATVRVGGGALEQLSHRAFEVFAYHVSKLDTVVAIEDLCKAIWGADNLKNRANARQQIKEIRDSLGQKLGDNEHGALISRYGVGTMALSSLGVQWVEKDDDPVLTLANGKLEVNPPVWLARVEGQIMSDLTPMEFKLLVAFARSPNILHNKRRLSLNLWGYTDKSTEDSIRVYVGNLRKKFKRLKLNNVIKTFHSVGYVGLDGYRYEAEADLSTV